MPERAFLPQNIVEIAEQIAELPLAVAISTGMPWQWAFPTIETLHVISISTVFGSIVLLDSRLLGLATLGHKLSKYASELLPLTWIAFLIAVVTGILMFISNAPDYLLNLYFQLKMGVILLAGLNMLVFQYGIFRRVDQWDLQQPPPPAARIAGLLSILCWTSVIFFGRWIGFTIDTF